MLEDYESDENDQSLQRSALATEGSLSVATQELMKKLGTVPSGAQPNEEDLDDELKIFYCSRTHSQLSQFINELRRVHLPPAVTTDLPDSSEQLEPRHQAGVGGLKHLTLGSRKNLCINPKVAKLKSVTAINEKCLELQRPGTPTEHECPYLPTKETEALVNEFRDHALAKIRDIEELPDVGRGLAICPYYAARSVIRPSEVSLLLNTTSRLTLITVDRYPSVSIATAEICERGPWALPEGPYRDH